MLAQTAERVYWFSRYIERTENIARLMLVRHQLILDLPANIQPSWRVLVEMLGFAENFDSAYQEATEKNVISFLFSDRSNPGSVISSIAMARENMRTTREVLPSEAWESVNALYLSVRGLSDKDLPRRQRHKVLNRIIKDCQNISGLLAGTMNHDEAYQFILIGRKIERTDMTSRIVDLGSASLKGERKETLPYQNVLWISILRSLSAYQMYRLNVRRKVEPQTVLHFLINSRVFPRAVAHNLIELEACVKRLLNHDRPLEQIRLSLSQLENVNVNDMRSEKLHHFLDDLQVALEKIHSSVELTWFHPEFQIQSNK